MIFVMLMMFASASCSSYDVNSGDEATPRVNYYIPSHLDREASPWRKVTGQISEGWPLLLPNTTCLKDLPDAQKLSEFLTTFWMCKNFLGMQKLLGC